MRTNVTFLTYVWKCSSKYVRSYSCHTVNGLRTIVRPHCVSTRSSDRKWLKPAGSDTGIKVYNSLTKQKEPLILAEESVAKWYVIRQKRHDICKVCCSESCNVTLSCYLKVLLWTYCVRPCASWTRMVMISPFELFKHLLYVV